MDVYQSRFVTTLCANLEEAIAEQSRLLADTVQPDYASYRQQVGLIKGLQRALKDARDLEEALSRPETKAPIHIVARQSYEA